MHLLEFYKRLADREEKRDNLKHELNNRLDPQEEREKLLLQVIYSNSFYEVKIIMYLLKYSFIAFKVREDNAAIAALDSNAANLKKQIKNVQDLIEQAEQVYYTTFIIQNTQT